jgi:hypothetical protein
LGGRARVAHGLFRGRDPTFPVFRIIFFCVYKYLQIVSRYRMSTPITNLPFNQGTATELPSRDIPRETIEHVTDPQVAQTYVPPPQVVYQPQPQPMKPTKADLLEEFKFPLMLSLLFYVFQLHAVSSTLLKMFPSLFEADGNMTTHGLMFKSLLFGAAYYGIMNFVVN